MLLETLLLHHPQLLPLQVERVTNHDVKAIEYVLKQRFKPVPELHKVTL